MMHLEIRDREIPIGSLKKQERFFPSDQRSGKENKQKHELGSLSNLLSLRTGLGEGNSAS